MAHSGIAQTRSVADNLKFIFQTGQIVKSARFSDFQCIHYIKYKCFLIKKGG